MYLATTWSVFLFAAALLYAIPGIPRCTVGWAFIFVLVSAFLACITHVYGTIMVARTQRKEELGCEFAPGEVSSSEWASSPSPLSLLTPTADDRCAGPRTRRSSTPHTASAWA